MKPEDGIETELTETDENETISAEAQTQVEAESGETNGESGGEAERQPVDLQAQLEEKEAQLKEFDHRLKRAQADFQNYKKRKEREQAEIFTMIEDRLLAESLPLFDDFQRAFGSLKDNGDQTSFIEGMERIFEKFKDYLDKKGIQPVNAVGEKFNPALHEVLLTVESEGDPHIVLEEFECGYTRQGRLLRPSRVTVSKRPKPPEPASQDEARRDDESQAKVENDHAEREDNSDAEKET